MCSWVVTPDSLCCYFNLRVPSATQLHQVRERFDVVRYRIGGRPPVAVQQQEPTTCTMRFRALNLSAEVVACWANEFLMESKQSACPAPALNLNAIGNTAWTAWPWRPRLIEFIRWAAPHQTKLARHRGWYQDGKTLLHLETLFLCSCLGNFSLRPGTG